MAYSVKCSGAFINDVTSAILVFQNSIKRHQINPVGVEPLSYVIKRSFVLINLHSDWPREWNARLHLFSFWLVIFQILMLFLSLTSTHLKLFLNSILDMPYREHLRRTSLLFSIFILRFLFRFIYIYIYISGQHVRQKFNGNIGINQQFYIPNEVVWPSSNNQFSENKLWVYRKNRQWRPFICFCG